MKHMTAFAAAAAVVVTCMTSPALAADTLLQRLAGDWIGRGVYLRNGAADPEPVYCRLSNELAADGVTLNQRGRCAITDTSAGMEVTITALGDGKYTGHGNGIGLGSRGQATLTGTGTADRLELTAELVDTATGDTETAIATMETAGDGYRLRIERAVPEPDGSVIATEIAFTRN